MRKYDLLAICLLTFSAVVAVAITLDPKGFILREWQPLIAAAVALGAANLAYSAAMAKVIEDRITRQEDKTQNLRGICLRLEFDLNVLSHKTDATLHRLQHPGADISLIITSESIAIEEPKGLTDAWDRLDAFPEAVAAMISELRGDIYNYNLAIGDDPQREWQSRLTHAHIRLAEAAQMANHHSRVLRRQVITYRQSLKSIASHAETASPQP